MKAKIKKCPSCNGFFTCLGDEDCWCEKIQISEKNMFHIMEKYNDCLCPDCLKKFHEK